MCDICHSEFHRTARCHLQPCTCGQRPRIHSGPCFDNGAELEARAKYLTAIGRDLEQLQRYVEGHGTVIHSVATGKGQLAAIVRAPDSHEANFCTGRLGSGLMGGHQQPSIEKAIEVMETLRDLC